MFNSSKFGFQAGIVVAMLSLSTSVLAIELTPDLQLHGYATAGFGRLSNNQGYTYPDPSGTDSSTLQSNVTGEHDSVAGIQLNYHVNNQIDFATQTYMSFENSKRNDYVFRVNWAYLDYKFNDEWAIRGGRFAFATYLYSDNLYVGEAYPWVRLPSEIYAELGGLYSENGLAVMYRHAFGDWILRVQPSFGQEKLQGYQANNITQITASLSNENLTLHAGSALADVDISSDLGANLQNSIDDALLGFGSSQADINQFNSAFATSVKLNKVRGTFSDVGFVYDDGRWFAAGEMGALRFSGFVDDFNAGYISAGYHFGKWLPYVMYASYKNVNQDEYNEIPAPGNAIYAMSANYDQSTISVGVRYKIKNNVSLKFQADQVSGFKGNYVSGFFVPPAEAANSPSTLQSVYIYSASLTAAF
ncbi:MAG: hypothetical protein KGO49_14855 [Gammaproteobacteria bacterium]|nr:hypothetical protein [Gammaproteobacteria bacterium]